MGDVRVRCVNKEPRQDPHHGITHLGGDNWKWSRAQVIASIEAGTNTFFTLVNGIRANVAVVAGPYGKYVRPTPTASGTTISSRFPSVSGGEGQAGRNGGSACFRPSFFRAARSGKESPHAIPASARVSQRRRRCGG
jgi:hypothetical protein